MKPARSPLISLLGVCCLVLLTAHPARAVDGVVLITQATASTGLPGCAAAPGYMINICHSGSYRLAGSLAVATGSKGIEISAPAVTLDLNGFGISGTGYLAVFSPMDRVTIRNGEIDGFTLGIELDGQNERVEDVTLADYNAVLINGGVIEHCIASGGGVSTEGFALYGDGAVRDSVASGFAYTLIASGNDQISGNQLSVVVTGAETVVITVLPSARLNVTNNMLTGPVIFQDSGSIGYGGNTISSGGAAPVAILSGGSAWSAGNNICLGTGPC